MCDGINTSKISTFWVLRCVIDRETFFLCRTVIGDLYLSKKLDFLLGDIIHHKKLALAEEDARLWNSHLPSHEEYSRVEPVQVVVAIKEVVKK